MIAAILAFIAGITGARWYWALIPLAVIFPFSMAARYGNIAQVYGNSAAAAALPRMLLTAALSGTLIALAIFGLGRLIRVIYRRIKAPVSHP